MGEREPRKTWGRETDERQYGSGTRRKKCQERKVDTRPAKKVTRGVAPLANNKPQGVNLTKAKKLSRGEGCYALKVSGRS